MAAEKSVNKGLLRFLRVEGFGLIERTEVTLEPGLNVFTGETGSGKSMIVDALDFVMGGRAGSDAVRSGHEKAVVSAEIDPSPSAVAWLTDAGFAIDDGEAVVVVREMTAQGRSSARINGSPAAAGQLRALGDRAIDVIAQHEHHALLQPARHRELLDAFGGSPLLEVRARLQDLVAAREGLQNELEALDVDETQAARALDDARYAIQEIEAARVRPGEFETLRQRRSVMANAAKISAAVAAAASAIDDAEIGAAMSLGRASRALDGVTQYSDHLRELAARVRELQSTVQEVSAALAVVADDDNFDAAQLDAIEDRLAVLERLMKKYGPTEEEIAASDVRYSQLIATYERRDEERNRCATELRKRGLEIAVEAERLTMARTGAAEKLQAAVESELQRLGMRGATFRCSIEPKRDGVTGNGADRVAFVAALNPKEPERPIAQAASGGELARLMLALKLVFEAVDSHPTVVLDEVDAGIGGAAARRVGARIAVLSETVQVLCITHLAQIAAFADHHVTLSKTTRNNRSTVIAASLGEHRAVRSEIARMLAGDASSAEALRHADALLREVKPR